MAIGLNVKADFKQLTRGLKRWERKVIPAATTSALNRAGKKVRTEIVRDLAKETGIKQKDIRSGIEFVKATFHRLSVFIKVSGRRFNVIRFSGKQTKSGLVAKPWKVRRKWPTGFIGNKGRTAFLRKSSRRGDIKALSGPGITSEFIRERAVKLMQTIGRVAFLKEFPRELKRRLGRL